MSTGNIDANTLADALAIALKPIRETQLKLLVMQTLSTMIGQEGIQRLHAEFDKMREELRLKEESIESAKSFGKIFTDEHALSENKKIVARLEGDLKTLRTQLAKFEEKNSLYIQALQTCGMY